MANRPKPIPIRKLQGNPGKRAIPGNVPEAPDIDDLKPPVGLDRYGKEAWSRNAPMLQQMGVLKANHVDALFAYCDAYAQLRRAQLILGKTFSQWKKSLRLSESADVSDADLYSAYQSAQRGASVDRKAARLDMRLFAVEFGMTPASQGRLQLATGKDENTDPMEGLLSGRRSTG